MFPLCFTDNHEIMCKNMLQPDRQATDANMIWFRKDVLYLQDDKGKKNMDTWLIIFNTCCFITGYFH